MRLEALLMTAGLAVASAGTAAASPADTCTPRTWIAETICKLRHETAQAQTSAREVDASPMARTATADAARTSAFSFWRALARPHSALDWFRDQLGKDTMISSSERPSTSPAATAPSDATRRKDGAPAGTRSP